MATIDIGQIQGRITLDTSDFKSGVKEAQSTLGDFGKTIESIGREIRNTGLLLTATFTAPIVKFSKDVLQFGMDFQDSMQRVQAYSGYAAGYIDELGYSFDDIYEKAVETGRTTVFTSVEAADALQTLALAGLDASQMFATLEDSLNLALIGEIEISEAAHILATSIRAMGDDLAGTINGVNTATYYTNALAAAATNSSTDVGELANGLAYLGGVSGDLSFDVQDVAIALGLMANNATTGQSAGRLFATALRRMAGGSEDAAAALERLGVSMFDANGNARPLLDFIIDLRTAFNDLGLSEQDQVLLLTELAGQNGYRALSGVVSSSEEDFWNLVNAVKASNDGMGAAAETVETITDTLSASWKLFTSAAQDTYRIIFERVEPILRDLLDNYLTPLVRSFGELSDAQIDNIIKWGLIIAAVGPVLVVIGSLVRSVGRVIRAIAFLGGGAARVGSLLGLSEAFATFSAGPIVLAIGAVSLLVDWFLTLEDRNKELYDAFTLSWGYMEERLSGFWSSVEGPLTEFGEAIQELGNSLYELWEAIKPLVDLAAPYAIASLFGTFISLFGGLTEAAGPAVNVLTDVANAIDGVVIAITGLLEGDFEQIADGALKIATSTSDAIYDIYDSVLSFIEGSITTLAETLGPLFGYSEDEIDRFTVNLSMMFGRSKDSLRDFIDDIQKNLGESGVLVGTLRTFSQTVEDAWSDTQYLKDYTDGFLNFRYFLLSIMSDILTDIADFLSNIPGIGVSLGAKFAESANNINEELSHIEEIVESRGGNIAELSRHAGDEISDSVQRNESMIVGDVVVAAGSITGSLVDKLKQEIPQVYSASESIMNNVSDAIYDTEGKPIEQAQLSTGKTMYRVLETTEQQSYTKYLDRAGDNINSGLGDGIWSSRGKAVTKARDVSESVYKVYTGNLKIDMGINIGRNFITGVNNGMVEQAEAKQSLLDNARIISTNLANIMNRTLKINSPSLVGYAIGDFFMQGINVGLESTAEKTYGILEDIADNISHAFDNVDFEVIDGATVGDINDMVRSADVRASGTGYLDASALATDNGRIISENTNTINNEPNITIYNNDPLSAYELMRQARKASQEVARA